ncbi:2-keto-4-pentenoate hydratase [Reyranella sp. CPCC 100927]|uniref:2-keto-4-pentenoate hydratase n=1 Tax=Reyranella sp. CPCC 100927 TaxID=2599616 RepID=UPI0011B5AE89|nr:fumarylacetoacetate hydrolase family protein [Reyranella sp. CPCC 100927]TWT08662.1 hypothetical protein FQU96_21815 [Reyranella sp. CPCC 100927]
MLDARALDGAVDALLAARRERRPMARLPAASAPQSIDDAYLIQEAFAQACGSRLAGYKVGAASVESQRFVGVSGPFAGHVYAATCFDSPAVIAAGDFFSIGVEAEFTFRLGRDLPSRERPYSRAEVTEAVAAVLPSIEICDTRLADWKAAGVAQMVADNGFHGGMVLAGDVADWRGLDLATHDVTLRIDGVLRGRGTGQLVLGHPLDSLAWLATDLSRRGRSLTAGAIVAAGTCTGLHIVHAPANVVADFGSLGTVGMTVVA